MKVQILQPLCNGCKVGRHGGRRRMKEGSWTLGELPPTENFEGVHPLNNFTTRYLPLPVDVPLPCALMTLSSSRSLCESLRSGSLRGEKGAMCSDSSNLEEQCSGLTIDWPIQRGYNHHSLVSFTHFFKAAFNLSLCLPIHAFDVVMPFLHLLNI